MLVKFFFVGDGRCPGKMWLDFGVDLCESVHPRFSLICFCNSYRAPISKTRSLVELGILRMHVSVHVVVVAAVVVVVVVVERELSVVAVHPLTGRHLPVFIVTVIECCSCSSSSSSICCCCCSSRTRAECRSCSSSHWQTFACLHCNCH